ncbi:hypothetical protein [uncultured Jatrophihabitans sp.]|uniref:hypothetical protein n=1 Tax=uncultured Jatrophihabitans sp. TaxID=1610747 RepID=UPI0035CBEB93
MSLSTEETLFVFCPTCARESLAEAPPCPDGHDGCCPDLACLECGTALLDWSITGFVRSAPRPGRPARRAA